MTKAKIDTLSSSRSGFLNLAYILIAFQLLQWKSTGDQMIKGVLYMANVAMKVNIKTGGVDHSVSKPHPILKGTLLLVVDATHSGGTSNPGTPSVAVVVGSLDAKCEISRLHALAKQRKFGDDCGLSVNG